LLKDQVAAFSRFVKFVNRLSDEANSSYGRRVLGTPSSKPQSKVQSTSDFTKSTSFYSTTLLLPSELRVSLPLPTPLLAFIARKLTMAYLSVLNFEVRRCRNGQRLLSKINFVVSALALGTVLKVARSKILVKSRVAPGTFHYTLLHPSAQCSTRTAFEDVFSTPPDPAISGCTNPNENVI